MCGGSDLDWLVRRNLMNGFVSQLQNLNAVVNTDERRLQREGSRRLGEGALGGIRQKKLGNRYETGDCQGQQTFLLLRVLLRTATSFPETTSGLYSNSNGHLL